MKNTDVLKELKDIHYPDPISWWPPAPGWYAVLIIIAIISFALGAWVFYRWQKKQREKLILEQLAKLKQLQQRHPKSPKVVSLLAIFLKKITLALYPRSEVASLSGEQWLAFLDKTGNTAEFSQGVGRLLLTAPYQPKPPEHTQELVELIETWIKDQLKRKL